MKKNMSLFAFIFLAACASVYGADDRNNVSQYAQLWPGLFDYETFKAAQEIYENIGEKSLSKLNPPQKIEKGIQIIAGLQYTRGLHGGSLENIETPWGFRAFQGAQRFTYKDLPALKIKSGDPKPDYMIYDNVRGSHMLDLKDDEFDDARSTADITEVNGKPVAAPSLTPKILAPLESVTSKAYATLLARYQKEKAAAHAAKDISKPTAPSGPKKEQDKSEKKEDEPAG
jgi:hypothetical protein